MQHAATAERDDPAIPVPPPPPEGRPAPAAPQPPPTLALPLETRAALLADGGVHPVAWRAEANAWATEADLRYRATTALRAARPTDGDIRLGVKDTVDVAGFATRLGLRRYRHHPRRTAEAVRRLRGASVIAKLATPELGIGLAHGCRNPRFPHLAPSGSSTGSAVAVASHLCDVALGTDTVASTRLPAAACGVVGLRTTHRPDGLDGVFPLSPSLDAVGWIARTADDLAYFWYRTGLGGPGTLPPARYEKTYRIGVVREVDEAFCAPEVRVALDGVSGLLSDAGHAVRPVRLGELWERRAAAYELCAYEAWRTYREWHERLDDDLDPATARALDGGAAVGEARYAWLCAARERAREQAAASFSGDAGVDAWLLPVTPGLPRAANAPAGNVSAVPHRDEADFDQRVGYCPVAAFAGLPALALPVALDPVHRAPIALQLVGAPGSEAGLIQLARQISRYVGHPVLPPAGPAGPAGGVAR
ncbi:amidase [Streptomyces sp. NPDC003444]